MINIDTNAANYAVGRNGCVPLAIYLHCTDKTSAQLLGEACRPVGESFHYSVHGNLVYQYVRDSDTAFTFKAAANPPIAGKPAGCTDNQSSINVGIECNVTGDNCGVQVGGWSSQLIAKVGELVCKIASANNLTPSSVNVLSDSLDIPVSQILAKAVSCNNPTLDGACLKPHEVISGANLPIAIWQGNCLVEAEVSGTVRKCDYTATIPFASNLDSLTSITVGGATYSPPSPIYLTTPVQLLSWLNSLGLGSWNVNYVSMTLPGSVQIRLLASSDVATAVTHTAGISGFTSSNCQNATGQVPATFDSILASKLVSASPAGGNSPPVPSAYTGENNAMYLSTPWRWIPVSSGGAIVGYMPVYRP